MTLQDKIKETHSKLQDIELQTFRFLSKQEEKKLLLKLELFEHELNIIRYREEPENE